MILQKSIENKPLISILVNCYNSESYLKQALDSIYSQIYQNFEIILVDNCSTDQTAIIAKLYDQRLKYFKTEKNVPLYAARNVGLEHVTGDFLCVLDSDDYWVTDKLDLQLKYMSNQPNIDILYSSYRSHYDAQDTGKNKLVKIYLKFINFSDNVLFDRFVKRSALIKNYNINFQTIMFRTSSLDGVRFDNNLNLMGDLDFVFRLLWLKNANIYSIKKVTAYSRIHERQLSRKSDLRWVIESIKVLRKIENKMTKHEMNYFKLYFIVFYYSSYLLTRKKYQKAIQIKARFSLNSIRGFMHFFKSVMTILASAKAG